ncbi:hypothetical protein RRG08_002996 [Elysia crispata]|uniref:4a-hydroxytetrahydrobiopterin dehydratase n=1 Tax=Elysia crispata TaxID=231223 RepID=A0AAE0ZVY0_9GAST|nr:hypothetical protein RRG08_002996 [Elysia crispata]
MEVRLDCLDIPQAANGDEDVATIIKVEDTALLVHRFQKGECYTSFEEFIGILQHYQQQNNVFFIRDSAERLKFDPDLIERLVYKYCLFSCKQGRKKDRGAAPKIRPNQSSFKVGCKAFIRLGLKQQHSGEYVLEVKSSNLEHNNHPITAENAFKYPENRRVQVDEKLKSVIISPEAKPKQVLEYIKKDQAKTLSSRDLYNLKRKLQQDEKPCPGFPSQKSAATKQNLLKPEERMVMLEPLLHNSWSVCSERDAIQKEFIFSNFNEAFRFITGIGLEANRTGHYPEWHNYNTKVGIILQTPSVSTITVKDINLAHYIDSLAV